MLENIKIESISNDYKGIAKYNGNKYFIDNAIPGDIINIEIVKKTNRYFLAKKVEFIKKSCYRINPVCPYFDKCGGCDLQYMNDDFYYKTKIETISKKITNSNFKIPKIEIYKIGKNERRKINLKYSDGKYGFFKRNSKEIIEVDNCLCICNELNEIITELKNIKFVNLESVDITKLYNGIHLTFNFFHKLEIEKLLIISLFRNISEIGYTILKKNNYKTIKINKKLIIDIDKLLIELPSRYFIQPTDKSQRFIIDTLKNELKNHKNIVDLYCGIGTYSLPLSRITNLTCFDIESTMINSIKHNKKLLNIKNLKSFTRNLLNNPLKVAELNKFNAAIINPPRTGAKNQCEYLSKSKIEKIIYISCNPDTLVRDLKLFNNSYKIGKIIIVDQFYWSKHTECITVLERI